MRESSGDWLEAGIGCAWSTAGIGWILKSVPLVVGRVAYPTFSSLLLGEEQIPLLRAMSPLLFDYSVAACCVYIEATAVSFVVCVKGPLCYRVQEVPLVNITNNKILHCTSKRSFLV